MPPWRNWQTHRTQNPAGAIPCRFDPDWRHITTILARPACRQAGSKSCGSNSMSVRPRLAAHKIKFKNYE